MTDGFQTPVDSATSAASEPVLSEYENLDADAKDTALDGLSAITEPGVLNVGPSHGALRRYSVLRIPPGVLKRVLAAREVTQAEQAGRTKR